MREILVKKFDDYIKNEIPIFHTYDLAVRLYKESDDFSLIIDGYYFAYTEIDKLTAFEMIANHLRFKYDILNDIAKDICELQGDDREKAISSLKEIISKTNE